MKWNATFKNVGIHGIVVLLVFIVGPAHTLLGSHNRRPSSDTENVGAVPLRGADSSASTAQVLRNIKKFLIIARPLVGGKRKLVKQEAEATEGAANALAYLTDSFGGQLAGQILSVILSSVTGDVRGILGNSLNLFQTDESRDRVQLFLDDISMNFLKFTGLQALVTTKSPLQQSTPYPGAPVLIGSGTGQSQLAPQAPAFPIASLGPGSSANAYVPASPTFGGSSGLVGGAAGGGVGSSATYLQQQQRQQAPQQATAAAQQPIIYVLPQLANGGTTSSGTTASKPTGSKVIKTTTASSSAGDDDSEEERRELWST